MIDAEERADMRASVRGAVADALAAGDADVDGVIDALGWREMLADEPGDAVDVVFTALGGTNATATALDDVLTSALGEKPRADLAVVLPAYTKWDPPGRPDGDALRVQGLATARAADAADLLVVCGPASEPRRALVPAADAAFTEIRGVDPGLGLRAVAASARAADAAPLDPAAWRSALALARRAVAHQITGACRSMLELARTHALERAQFGAPIARFQAVRHKLAEVLVAVESAEAALDAARDEASPETAALAKAVAGRSAQVTARHCQQVCAGIGFTTEHALHRYLERTIALEGLFGSTDALVLDIGRTLLAEQRVPTLIEL